MITQIERFFKRIKLKTYIWITKGSSLSQSQEDDISSYEKTCFRICLKTIKHKNTKFMIAPMSQKRYLENKDMDIFITISDGRIDLTNHVYHYDVKLTKRDWERITYVFDNETEKRRLKYEDIVNSQIRNSLDNVLQRISNLTDDSTN